MEKNSAAKKENQLTGGDIRRIRQALHLTQKDLASAANLTQSSVSLYENGEQPIPKDTLRKFCLLLGIQTEEPDGEVSSRIVGENADKEPFALKIHKQRLIRRLEANIKAIETLSPKQLFILESNIEELQTHPEDEPVAKLFVKNVRTFFNCQDCMEFYGSCKLRDAAKSQENICYCQWLNYVSNSQITEDDEKGMDG